MSMIRWFAVALILIVVVIATIYLLDIRRAYDRISGFSTVVSSPYGDIEFTEGGSGVPVLVIHGSGGGYDQGELIAHAVIGDEMRWIAPSRFGYLRSTFHQGATFDDQAHAYAALLDHLGVKRVAVVALSHGGPSALLFALLHPERVSSLTLISCGVVSSTGGAQAQADEKGNMLKTIYQYDPLYWSISKLLRGTFIKLMGADNALVAALSDEQRQLVDQVIDTMNPVSPRSAGVTLDNAATLPDERIAAIRIPTLIFHARDDGLQLYRNAEFAANNIPGSTLRSFEKGGHLLFAVEQQTIRSETRRFILDHIEKQ